MLQHEILFKGVSTIEVLTMVIPLQVYSGVKGEKGAGFQGLDLTILLL